MIAVEKVPNTWEDFLRPELKGRKFLIDIRPHGMVSPVAGLGESWVKNYASRLKDQEPIWVRGYARALASMSAGEYALHQQANYQSCVEVAEKHPKKSIVCKIIEPVPVRLIELQGVTNSAANPYAALLWLEFQATPVGPAHHRQVRAAQVLGFWSRLGVGEGDRGKEIIHRQMGQLCADPRVV